jgi:hypothetical protein
MKYLKLINLSISGISILACATIVWANQNYFVGVMSNSAFIHLCTLSLVFTFLAISSRTEALSGKLILTILSALSLIASIFLFVEFKPTYDVEGALNVVKSYSIIENLKLNDVCPRISATPAPNMFIDCAYLFSGEVNSNPADIIFNPETGEYYIN